MIIGKLRWISRPTLVGVPFWPCLQYPLDSSLATIFWIGAKIWGLEICGVSLEDPSFLLDHTSWRFEYGVIVRSKPRKCAFSWVAEVIRVLETDISKLRLSLKKFARSFLILLQSCRDPQTPIIKLSAYLTNFIRL